MKKILISFILNYLRFFAKLALQLNKPAVIGITGSVGKSSARDMLYTILNDYYPTKKISGNSETGIPLGILGLQLNSLGFQTPLKSIYNWLSILLSAPFHITNLKGTKYLIVEMGVDEPDPPKNMDYLLTIIKPYISILLNAAPVHTMQFEKVLPIDCHAELVSASSEEIKNRSRNKFGMTKRTDFLVQKIAEEKAKIINQSECKIGIYNADNPYVVNSLCHAELVSASNTKEQGIPKPASRGEQVRDDKTLLTFGKSKSNDISYTDYRVDLNGTSFSFHLNNLSDQTDLNLEIKDYLLPQANQETLAAVILTGLQLKLTKEQIKKSLEQKFYLPYGRSTLLYGINNSIIIDSSYNASRVSTESMLDLVKQLKKQTNRSVVFLFGDMRELGNESQSEHEIIAKKLIGIVDYLYLVGHLTRQFILPTYNLQLTTYNLKEVRWFDSSIRAGEYLKEHLPKDSIVLVKGSQNTIFLEEAIKYILADKKDITKLCRQDDYWLKLKNNSYQL